MSSTLGLGLLELLIPGLELLAVGQEGLVCQGGLVLQADPIPGLMIFYCMLQGHYFHAFSDFSAGEFTFNNEGAYSIGKGMHTFAQELLQV